MDVVVGESLCSDVLRPNKWRYLHLHIHIMALLNIHTLVTIIYIYFKWQPWVFTIVDRCAVLYMWLFLLGWLVCWFIVDKSGNRLCGWWGGCWRCWRTRLGSARCVGAAVRQQERTEGRENYKKRFHQRNDRTPSLLWKSPQGSRFPCWWKPGLFQ